MSYSKVWGLGLIGEVPIDVWSPTYEENLITGAWLITIIGDLYPVCCYTF